MWTEPSPTTLSTAGCPYGCGDDDRLRRLPDGRRAAQTVGQRRRRRRVGGVRQGSGRGVKALVDELIHSSAAAEGGGRCTGQPLCWSAASHWPEGSGHLIYASGRQHRARKWKRRSARHQSPPLSELPLLLNFTETFWQWWTVHGRCLTKCQRALGILENFENSKNCSIFRKMSRFWKNVWDS